MSAGFRQSISGLHTWGGLVFAWLLMAIFVAGTICVFSEAITAWMRGEPHQPPGMLSVEQREQALAFAAGHLERMAPGAQEWEIHLSDDRVRVEWHDAADEEQEVHLDPRSGGETTTAAKPQGRATAGGYNFVAFHYNLHAGFAGVLLVRFVTMAMLVALASGVIVHKRIFKDFFTLRLGKGQRSWLDGHNAASVLTLPFQLMIVYTGLVIFQGVWMPASIAYHYGMPDGLERELWLSTPYWDAQRAQSPRARALAQAGTGSVDVQPADVPALANEAMQRSALPVGWVVREKDAEGIHRLWIGMVQPDPETLARPADVAFLVVGDPVRLHQEDRFPFTEAERTRGVLIALHEARFGGWTAKWLWFLCGVVGCVMIATGLVLFSVKRRQRSGNEFGRATPEVYRLIDALNVAAVAGICLASIVYFWVNRIIPADLAGREVWEIRLFLLAWAATPLHALLRPGRRGWAEQLGLTALLCLTLPLLNLATTGDWFGAYVTGGRWLEFGVEAVALALGALFAAAACQIAKARPA